MVHKLGNKTYRKILDYTIKTKVKNIDRQTNYVITRLTLYSKKLAAIG